MDNNKFQFVDVEDITDEEIKNSIEIVVSPEKVKVDSVEPKKEEIPVEIAKRKYFSFEARIVVSVLSILVLFVGACFLGLKVINHTTTRYVKYVENGDFTYQVCLKNATCEPENIIYHGDSINIIKISFRYDAKYEKKITYNKNYHISALIKAVDKNTNEVVFNKENDLVDITNKNDDSDFLSIAETVTIDYSKYLDMLKDYPDSNGQVEAVLYLEEENETRKVSSLTIPITKGNFELTKYSTTSSNRYAKVTVNVWDTYSLVYAIATSFLTVISLILIYRTTRLVLKVTNNKSRYEQAIDDILRDYDSSIVIARDGYESTEEKEINKVESFEALLEIKNRLNKPIIFSVINDVKCEFIVEDEKVLHKYVMKEADFLEDEKINLENK